MKQADDKQDIAQHLEELLEKLHLSMIETHYRVKNSFQLVRSLLNMELRGKESLDREVINKISSHLSGLAHIHDLLTEQVKRKNENAMIVVDELMRHLISNLPINSSQGVSKECEKIQVQPRIGSTLAVVTNELLLNSLKHGTGGIVVKIRMLDNVRACLSIDNDFASEQDLPTLNLTQSMSAGMQLIQFLAQADFKSDVQWKRITDDDQGVRKVHVEFEFPAIAIP